nr:type II secretion system protein GspJ [Fertoeibacter niger]
MGPDPGPDPGLRKGNAGVTLIEVLVALALFALIGGAGFAMLDQVLRTQSRTEGRLERLAEMQRAMYLVSQDFAQARGRSLRVEATPDGPQVTLRRAVPQMAEGTMTLRYALTGDVLTRSLSRAAGPPLAVQPLLTGVAGVEWVFHGPAGWGPDWPPPGTVALAGQAPANPAAVALRLTLAEGGNLRRVALLPAEAR